MNNTQPNVNVNQQLVQPEETKKCPFCRNIRNLSDYSQGAKLCKFCYELIRKRDKNRREKKLRKLSGIQEEQPLNQPQVIQPQVIQPQVVQQPIVQPQVVQPVDKKKTQNAVIFDDNIKQENQTNDENESNDDQPLIINKNENVKVKQKNDIINVKQPSNQTFEPSNPIVFPILIATALGLPFLTDNSNSFQHLIRL